MCPRKYATENTSTSTLKIRSVPIDGRNASPNRNGTMYSAVMPIPTVHGQCQKKHNLKTSAEQFVASVIFFLLVVIADARIENRHKRDHHRVGHAHDLHRIGIISHARLPVVIFQHDGI